MNVHEIFWMVVLETRNNRMMSCVLIKIEKSFLVRLFVSRVSQVNLTSKLVITHANLSVVVGRIFESDCLSVCLSAA